MNNQSTPADIYGTSWINAEKFGFVADGETPNDKIMSEYVQNYSDTPLYFGKGVYAFAQTINFPDRVYLNLDPQAELKCIAEEPLDYFITLRGQYIDVENAWCKFLKYAHQCYINGGVINGNHKVKCALGLFQGMHTNFENFRIMNVLEKGIQTRISKTGDGCYNFRNVYIYNPKQLKGSIGINDNSADNHYDRCEVVNFETAFCTRGGRFIEASAWNLDFSCIETCVFARIEGPQSVWYNPSVDTYRYGFYLANNHSTSIIDMTWITNMAFYTEEMQKEYPCTAFYCEGDAKTNRTSVTGLQFHNANQYLQFSNAEMPNASFMNVRAPFAHPEEVIKDYRNDSDAIRSVLANHNTGVLNAASDLNALCKSGTYRCELGEGAGGTGLPPVVGETGLLTVDAYSGLVVQTYTDTTSKMERFFDGATWGAWRTLAK